MVREFVKPDCFERLARAVLALRLGNTLKSHAELHVIEHGAPGK